MEGLMFLPKIHHAKDLDEDAYDILQLISILAYRRAETIGKDVSVLEFEFAADIWCIIFDPIKLFAFSDGVKRLRKTYKGIRTDIWLQEKCRDSFTSELLHAKNTEEAINLSFPALFR